MAAFVERVPERPHRLVGGKRNGIFDAGGFGMDRDRLVPLRPRLQADPFVRIAAFVAVHVLDMDLDMGEPLLEPFQPGADLLLEPCIGIRVALDLVVGVDLNEHSCLRAVADGRIMRSGTYTFRRGLICLMFSSCSANPAPWRSRRNAISARPADR